MGTLVNVRAVLDARCIECGRPVWNPKDEAPEPEACAVVWTAAVWLSGPTVEAFCSRECATSAIGEDEQPAPVSEWSDV